MERSDGASAGAFLSQGQRVAGRPNSLEIGAAPSRHQPAALRLVFRSLAAPQRESHVQWTLAEAAAGRLSLSGLLAASEGDDLQGAIWAQLHPGKTVSIWLPQVALESPADLPDALLAAVTRYAQAQGARLAQAVLETDDAISAARFERQGYRRLTDLIYLVSLHEDFPSSAPAGPFEFEACDEMDGRLAGLLERTYHGTLDCPALNGVRELSDVLAGYRAVGDPAGVQWLIVKRQEQDIGCLLLADHPAEDTAELVYMGLTPEHRERGLGLAIARHAQWLARDRGRPRLVLAVDAANLPALHTYAKAGFVVCDRRTVLVHLFD